MRWKCSDLCGSLRLTEGSQLANGRHPSPLKWLVLVVGNLGSSQLGAGWAVLTCCGRLWMASWGQFDRVLWLATWQCPRIAPILGPGEGAQALR